MGNIERWSVLLVALGTIMIGLWRGNRALIGRLDSIDSNTKAWQEMRAENMMQKKATEANTRAIEMLTRRLEIGGL